ncbi:MAG TPA: choice-of-anchor tandem repeat GloVer-containing protein [Verrucomicrobiae bacterium]|jgi:uncharacterized repeat protein (TIGR03803 family)
MKHYMVIFLLGLTGLIARGQSITPICSFNNFTNGPERPLGELTMGPDGNWYSTSIFGGSNNDGTVFELTTNDVLTTLVSFAGTNGANPYAGLTLGPDGSLYGVAAAGGNNNDGTIFRVTTNGILTTLVEFDSVNGSGPEAALTLGPDGNFYGTTKFGGPLSRIVGGRGDGTVFQMMTNGTLTTLVTFTNVNGALPDGSLTVGPDGNLYGTTSEGGGPGSGAGYGTVFRMTTNGVFTRLAVFNANGEIGPNAGLTLGPDNNFYGTTEAEGGSVSNGTIFMVTTNGVLTSIFTFDGTNGTGSEGNLALGPDGNLYGTTSGGGSNDDGTVFKITTNGLLTTLANFNGTNGDGPAAGLTLGPDGNFYGTTGNGGSGGNGVVYRLDLPPEFLEAPTSQSIVIGNGATLNATAFGTVPFSYQWLSNGVPIDEATNSQLAIEEFVTNTQYQVVISNIYGNATSSVATLTAVAATPAVSLDANGDVILSLATSTNFESRLYMATNLTPPVVWQSIYTNVGGGIWQFTDTNAAAMNSGRFYLLSTP